MFLPDLETERRKHTINGSHLRSHREINSLFRELEKKYCNMKMENVKEVLEGSEIFFSRKAEKKIKQYSLLLRSKI